MQLIKYFALSIGFFLVAVQSWAIELREDHPTEYVVKKGDTLWDIAAVFLKDPWFWPEIWHSNPQINNPHLIYPGDELTLVYIDGKPVLKFKTEDKLEPKIRVINTQEAIPVIPLNVIKPFLSRTGIVSEDEYDDAPYILTGTNERVMYSKTDQLYVRGLETDAAQGSYSVYRIGKPYIDPQSEEVLGYEAVYLGDADVLVADDPGLVEVTTSVQELKQGDRLFPSNENRLPSNFRPARPERKIDAKIISVYGGVTQIGQFNVVVLNKGSDDDMTPGHTLDIYKSGNHLEDPISTYQTSNQTINVSAKFKNSFAGIRRETVKLPDEHVGELMVFRVFEKVSLALVTVAKKPVHVMDKVVSSIE